MEKLLDLLLRIRSEANSLQKTKSEKGFKDGCLRLSRLADETISIWYKAETGISGFEQESVGELLCNLWCDALSTSTMREGGEYLRRCTWTEIQYHVNVIAAALHGVGKGYRSADSRSHIKNLCAALIDCCDETRHVALKPGVQLYPPPRIKPLHTPEPTAPDYSEERPVQQRPALRVAVRDGKLV